MAAIIAGKLPRSFDPAVSEWGNLAIRNVGLKVPKIFPSGDIVRTGREPPELKHLSRVRKRNQ